jgi:hypothetical protein
MPLPAVRVGHVDETDWDIYIGNANEARGLGDSPWRCPFTLDDAGGSREAMLAKYRVYVLEQPDLVRRLPLLRVVEETPANVTPLAEKRPTPA